MMTFKILVHPSLDEKEVFAMWSAPIETISLRANELCDFSNDFEADGYGVTFDFQRKTIYIGRRDWA